MSNLQGNIERIKTAIEDIADAIENKGVEVPECAGIEDYDDLISQIPTGSGSGSSVSWTPEKTSGDPIGTLTIDGQPNVLYCNSSSGSGDGSNVQWNQIQGSSNATKIAEITINGTKKDVYAPNGSGGSSGNGDVTANGALSSNQIILGGGAKIVKASGKTITSNITNDSNSIPTTKAVKDYVDNHGGGGGSSTPTIAWVQQYNNTNKVDLGYLNVNGNSTHIYAPAGGSGGGEGEDDPSVPRNTWRTYPIHCKTLTSVSSINLHDNGSIWNGAGGLTLNVITDDSINWTVATPIYNEDTEKVWTSWGTFSSETGRIDGDWTTPIVTSGTKGRYIVRTEQWFIASGSWPARCTSDDPTDEGWSTNANITLTEELSGLYSFIRWYFNTGDYEDSEIFKTQYYGAQLQTDIEYIATRVEERISDDLAASTQRLNSVQEKLNSITGTGASIDTSAREGLINMLTTYKDSSQVSFAEKLINAHSASITDWVGYTDPTTGELSSLQEVLDGINGVIGDYADYELGGDRKTVKQILDAKTGEIEQSVTGQVSDAVSDAMQSMNLDQILSTVSKGTLYWGKTNSEDARVYDFENSGFEKIHDYEIYMQKSPQEGGPFDGPWKLKTRLEALSVIDQQTGKISLGVWTKEESLEAGLGIYGRGEDPSVSDDPHITLTADRIYLEGMTFAQYLQANVVTVTDELISPDNSFKFVVSTDNRPSQFLLKIPSKISGKADGYISSNGMELPEDYMISWQQFDNDVSDYITDITSDTIKTTNVTAQYLTVKAANISGSLEVGNSNSSPYLKIDTTPNTSEPFKLKMSDGSSIDRYGMHLSPDFEITWNNLSTDVQNRIGNGESGGISGWDDLGTTIPEDIITQIGYDLIATNSLVANKLKAGSGSNIIEINGTNGIQSGNYSAGNSGFKIDLSGNAEFNNVTVRGYVENNPNDGNSAVKKIVVGTPSGSGEAGTLYIELT